MKRQNSRQLAGLVAVVRRLRSFRKATGGATAVEFALVSLPFFLLLMGIFELGLIFMLSTTLDNALADATRQIRTGQYQTAGSVTAAKFQSDICTGLGWLKTTCTTNLRTDVQTFTTFKAASTGMPSPVTNHVYNPATLTGYKNTAPCDIVVVRAYYRWPMIAPGIHKTSSSLSDGSILLTSTVAFRNEPFTASVTSC